MIYKNNIGYSIIWYVFTSISYIIVAFLAVFTVNGFKIPQINFLNFIVVIIIYLAILYYYLTRTNYDFETMNDSIRVTNRFLPTKTELILYKDISKIEFTNNLRQIVRDRHQRNFIEKYAYLFFSEFIMLEYKCVEITTTKRSKYYCFGIEYDMWNTEGPWLEDLYLELYKKGVNVEWVNKDEEWLQDLDNKSNI